MAPRVSLHGVDHEPAKIWRLGVYCYRATYMLPLYVTTLCIAIAFCIWVHEMRIQASSAKRDSYVRTRYTTLCRQLVAKLSGITEWYKAVQLEVRTHMQPVLRTKNCM